jgi:hypothetical protein
VVKNRVKGFVYDSVVDKVNVSVNPLTQKQEC